MGYVLAWPAIKPRQRRDRQRADALAARLAPSRAWQRYSAGAKGAPRVTATTTGRSPRGRTPGTAPHPDGPGTCWPGAP